MLLVFVQEFQDEIATAIELGFDLGKVTTVHRHRRDSNRSSRRILLLVDIEIYIF